jgi:hypothetical protein
MLLAEVSIVDGKIVTTFICLDGEFDISIPGVAGTVKLKPGMKITISEGMTVMPDTVPASNDEIDRLLNGTDVGYELSFPGPAQITVTPGGAVIQPAGPSWPTGPAEIMGNPPPGNWQPPVKNTTPVNIDVRFP